MPSEVPHGGFQFGNLAQNPCSTTVYDLGNGVSATGRELRNYIPSLVRSEYLGDPSKKKHTSKGDPGWMLKLNDSEPFAVKISANLSKNMRDGRSRQKIVPPSRLPKGYVMNQQVENLHTVQRQSTPVFKLLNPL